MRAIVIGITEELRARARDERIAMLRGLVRRMRRIRAAGDDCFLVPVEPGAFDRVYGGLMLADAMMAAAATVPEGRRIHSLHSYFLRLGDPALETSYKVERLRDTRTFSARQVRAEQAGKAINTATFSFTAPTTGFAHQWPMPETPAPETVTPRDVALIARGDGMPPYNGGVPWPIDMRHVDHRPWDGEPSDGRNRIWMRADEEVGDDPLLHACLLLYASDLTMADAYTGQHPIIWEDLIAARGIFGASMDHAFWLHRPVRIDRWLLHVQESSRAVDGRGFTTGRFFDEDGNLVASVAQEIFIKEIGEQSS
jgi:acyl-CoA thioesterase-2